MRRSIHSRDGHSMAELFYWLHMHASQLLFVAVAVNGYTITSALAKEQQSIH